MYEKVVKNLEILRDLKKKAKVKHPLVQVNIVLNKKNINEIEELLNVYSNDLKVEQIAIHGLRAYPETKEVVKDILPSMEEASSVINLVNKMKEKWKSDISLLPLTSHLMQVNTESENKPTKDSFAEKFKFMGYHCFEPWYDMMINPDGTVARCAAFTTRNEQVSIRKNSLREIWFGAFLNQVRDNIANGRLMEGCNPCGLMSNTIVIRETLKMFIEKHLKGDLNRMEEIKPLLASRVEKDFDDKI
jgi:MoaA/NifB/PqqE/SkfB family radical SAM enzyme